MGHTHLNPQLCHPVWSLGRSFPRTGDPGETALGQQSLRPRKGQGPLPASESLPQGPRPPPPQGQDHDHLGSLGTQTPSDTTAGVPVDRGGSDGDPGVRRLGRGGENVKYRRVPLLRRSRSKLRFHGRKMMAGCGRLTVTHVSPEQSRYQFTTHRGSTGALLGRPTPQPTAGVPAPLRSASTQGVWGSTADTDDRWWPETKTPPPATPPRPFQ